ncbi:hypothetical protein D3C78_1542800 [compost metagenome]
MRLLLSFALGFNLLLGEELLAVFEAMLRAAPPYVVECGGEFGLADFAGAAHWFTHGHHPEPVPG